MSKEKTYIHCIPKIIDGIRWYEIYCETVDKKGRHINGATLDFYKDKVDAIDFCKLCVNNGIPQLSFELKTGES